MNKTETQATLLVPTDPVLDEKQRKKFTVAVNEQGVVFINACMLYEIEPGAEEEFQSFMVLLKIDSLNFENSIFISTESAISLLENSGSNPQFVSETIASIHQIKRRAVAFYKEMYGDPIEDTLPEGFKVILGGFRKEMVIRLPSLTQEVADIFVSPEGKVFFDARVLIKSTHLDAIAKELDSRSMPYLRTRKRALIDTETAKKLASQIFPKHQAAEVKEIYEHIRRAALEQDNLDIVAN
jgi:hypothetical protein